MENSDVEVDQQSNTLAGELQVCEQLCLMHRQYTLDRFELNQNFIRDDEVDAVFSSGLDTFVRDGVFDLTAKRNVLQAQFLAHAFLVNRFEETWT
jgi:hypothetical protein